ncbi:MAG: GUN4 domain-containing protein [Cyanobacteria bacterium P01_H01_bin.15]
MFKNRRILGILGCVLSGAWMPLVEAQETDTFVSPVTQVDYGQLAEALEVGDWKTANTYTISLLYQAAGVIEEANNFRQVPCEDVQLVENLWQTASEGRFGFGVQLGAYQAAGNRPGRLANPTNYEAFGERVGWRQAGSWVAFIGNLNYSLDAPVGHLPAVRNTYEITGGRLNYSLQISQRVAQCGLDSTLAPTPLPAFQL